MSGLCEKHCATSHALYLIISCFSLRFVQIPIYILQALHPKVFGVQAQILHILQVSLIVPELPLTTFANHFYFDILLWIVVLFRDHYFQ